MLHSALLRESGKCFVCKACRGGGEVGEFLSHAENGGNQGMNMCWGELPNYNITMNMEDNDKVTRI